MESYNKSDLIKMVQRVIDCDEDDDIIEKLLEELDENVPHPAISDLIYWPEDETDCSAEKIVQTALSYKWEENCKILYSQSMKCLIGSDRIKDINRNSDKKFLSDSEIYIPSVNYVESTKDVENIVKKNTIDLNKLSSASDFEKLLILVNKLEYCIKEIYPNKMFFSYFIYKESGDSVFKFHADYFNIDWIDDDDICSSSDCIRKKFF